MFRVSTYIISIGTKYLWILNGAQFICVGVIYGGFYIKAARNVQYQIWCELLSFFFSYFLLLLPLFIFLFIL